MGLFKENLYKRTACPSLTALPHTSPATPRPTDMHDVRTRWNKHNLNLKFQSNYFSIPNNCLLSSFHTKRLNFFAKALHLLTMSSVDWTKRCFIATLSIMKRVLHHSKQEMLAHLAPTWLQSRHLKSLILCFQKDVSMLFVSC